MDNILRLNPILTDAFYELSAHCHAICYSMACYDSVLVIVKVSALVGRHYI